jgi:hypothetical protein
MYYDIDLKRLEECKEAYLNEDGQEYESESDLEDENSEKDNTNSQCDPLDFEKDNEQERDEKCGGPLENDDLTLTIEERQNLRHELLRVIKERFLSGQDDLFDYSIVDNCSEFDDMDFDNMRLEDDYFDSEEPS